MNTYMKILKIKEYIQKIKAIAPQGPHMSQLEQLTANTED